MENQIDSLDQDFFSRVAEVIAEELAQPERWFYLSFADGEFRGAVVVKAKGVVHALRRVNELGQNPGGEVLCVGLPKDEIPEPRFCDRLLTKPEITEMWGEPCKTIREWENLDA